ncbi:recombinase family protein [Cryobacterium sp. CG_9.6]|uniref:recombinase family protein n=1 Tax=Cryobacterium sp. CG_9.6 TaxID=2760710 RepID=UPI0024747AE9|nr:recombinase family protein [Cryobacterium sp. CG_9.6]MDH6236243.1 DNA invertase Pin-like site-specific DNA recombinase [Cryobacterium sp. CG_9.6]
MDCVIYTRVSLDRTGEALAVARQEQECRALAERLGLTVVHTYTDNDISATTGKVRPDFEAMLKAQPEAIIAWHQDRLLRLTKDLERVIELNVPVYTVTAGTLDLTTPAGRAVARTVAAWSQYEGEQKATRQVAANVQRAVSGVHSGRMGYGYRREGAAAVLHFDEATTIRSAVARVLDGESLRAICKDLDTQQAPTPGRGARWNSTTLKQLLLRPSLAGLTIHRGQVLGHAHADSPRVIDEDTHERIKALLTDPRRRSGNPGRAPKYLLSGIARCGRCDGVMARAIGRMTTTKTGGVKRQPPSYVCSECYRVRRKQTDVDALVEGIVVGRLQMPDAAQLFATGDPAALQEARVTIEALDARLSNAADMFATGGIDGGQLTRISEILRADRAQAAAAVEAALPAAVPAELMSGQAAEAWVALSMDSKRAVLTSLVTVTILPSGSGKAFNPDTVRVTWKG